MLKLSFLLVSALAVSGVVAAQAEPTDTQAEPRDPKARPEPTEPTPPTDAPIELGGRTYWDIGSCHSYSWMKNHGTWLCAIHGEIQIMFDPRHQGCGSLYGSFWHQCAYQI